MGAWAQTNRLQRESAEDNTYLRAGGRAELQGEAGMTNPTALTSPNGMLRLLRREGKTTLAQCLEEVRTYR